MEIVFNTKSASKRTVTFTSNLVHLQGASGAGKSYFLRSLYSTVILDKNVGCISKISWNKHKAFCFIDSRNLISSTAFLTNQMKDNLSQSSGIDNDMQTLSNGQSFRFYLDYAFTLAKFIIIDEGFGSLDQKNRDIYADKCLEFLSDCKDRHIVFCSHIKVRQFNMRAQIVNVD